jgi:myo-inositol-1(or 4)-monophosphatase
MDRSFSRATLAAAVRAAHAAGRVMRRNLCLTKKINQATQHDIKLELDVRCQKLIERTLRRAFPTIPILGEEGVLGNPEAAVRWVVDPIDGTVNFTYGIPHACVSIALQVRLQARRAPGRKGRRRDGGEEFQTVVGVVYDPFTNELWTAIRGEAARLNGRAIRASDRKKFGEAIVAIGFAKGKATLARTLPTLDTLIHRVRKIRIMGAAALALVYVASGRMDGYIEYGLRLWDIAAGGLIIECAGGSFWSAPVEGEHAYRIVASNRGLATALKRVADAGAGKGGSTPRFGRA